jgi:glycosyltransferase involved in cell wall biosynthesis
MPIVADRVKYVVALTKWHAWYLQQCYPWLKDCELVDLGSPASFVEDGAPHPVYYEGEELLNPPKLVVIGNGIETDFYKDWDVKRRPNRFIWSSSPDRGLLELLRHWKKIRQELKDATLHIFYGWEYFDTTLFIPEQRRLKEEIKSLLSQPGVKWEGRVGQAQLVQEFKKSSFWFYPLHEGGGGFRETFCITAVEAQAAGCLCVARASGGLGETVHDRGVLIPQDAGNRELDYLFDLVYDTDRQEQLRQKGREWAMKQTWASVAKKVLEVCNG